MNPCGRSFGNSLMKFFRRSSSLSIPSSLASSSIVSSIRWVASGRPAPRMASVVNLFVNTPTMSVWTAAKS